MYPSSNSSQTTLPPAMVMKKPPSHYLKYGTEPQKIIASCLYDDTKHVLSSFEMNKIASLTFGNCLEIFEIFQATICYPADYSILSIHKALASLKHVLIYGHERVIQILNEMRPYIGQLLHYNTALQSSSKSSIMGGAVDTAGPVREKAKELYDLVSKPLEEIQRVREQSADPTSLVPVGNKDDLGYTSNDYLTNPSLQNKYAESQASSVPSTKSNLMKSEGGFGGGFYPRDASGKVVIGAAHSIEEMMKVAATKEKERISSYSDVAPTKTYNVGGETLQKSLDSSYTRQMMAPDLLDMNFQGAVTKQTYSSKGSDPFNVSDKEKELQKALDEQRKELEELKSKMNQQQQVPIPVKNDQDNSLLNMNASVTSYPSEQSHPKPSNITSAASAISSMENIPSYASPSPQTILSTVPTQVQSSPSQIQSSFQQFNQNQFQPPSHMPCAQNQYPNSTSDQFPSMAPPEVSQEQEFQSSFGVMGGNIGGPKRNLQTGESSNLGDIPQPPPPTEMPPPIPTSMPPNMPPPIPSDMPPNMPPPIPSDIPPNMPPPNSTMPASMPPPPPVIDTKVTSEPVSPYNNSAPSISSMPQPPQVIYKPQKTEEDSLTTATMPTTQLQQQNQQQMQSMQPMGMMMPQQQQMQHQPMGMMMPQQQPFMMGAMSNITPQQQQTMYMQNQMMYSQQQPQQMMMTNMNPMMMGMNNSNMMMMNAQQQPWNQQQHPQQQMMMGMNPMMGMNTQQQQMMMNSQQNPHQQNMMMNSQQNQPHGWQHQQQRYPY